METTDAMTITIPRELAQRVIMEAHVLGVTPTERVLQALDGAVAPAENVAERKAVEGLALLTHLLRRVPSVTLISHSSMVAWYVVQGLGFVLNSLSSDEPLPTIFRPVSSPPHLNGGPGGHLAWVVEAQLPFLDAGTVASFLQDRPPRPVAEEARWLEADAFDSRGSEQSSAPQRLILFCLASASRQIATSAPTLLNVSPMA